MFDIGFWLSMVDQIIRGIAFIGTCTKQVLPMREHQPLSGFGISSVLRWTKQASNKP
jgi:hypothetical protein